MIWRSFPAFGSSWIYDAKPVKGSECLTGTGPPKIVTTLSLLFSALFATGAFAADSIGEPDRSSGKKNPLNKEHLT